MQRAVPRLRFCLTRAASSSAPKDHWDALDMSGHSLASLFSDAATVLKNDDEGKSLKTRLLERSACDVFLQPHERPPALSDQPSLDDPQWCADIEFDAPTSPGEYKVVVHVRSSSMIGVDAKRKVSFSVCSSAIVTRLFRPPIEVRNACTRFRESPQKKQYS